jgi:hypothetical protein
VPPERLRSAGLDAALPAFSAPELIAASEHNGSCDNLGSGQATSPFLGRVQHARTCGRSDWMERYQHRKTLDFSRHYTHIGGRADISKECTQSGGVPHISGRLPIALGDRVAARDDWDSQYLSWEEVIRRVRVYMRKCAETAARRHGQHPPHLGVLSRTLRSSGPPVRRFPAIL